MSAEVAASSLRFVLIGVSHPGNVGAAARAMKVMGFSDLVLVAPRFDDVLQRAEARAMASGATDVLESARTVATFDEALDGITYVCATAMTPRDFGPATWAPRALFGDLAARADRVALVFGSERFGLGNEDVRRCHACISIPTAPGYGSLNLAQAVQVLAYEWRQALGGWDAPRTVADARVADVPAVQRLLEHGAQALAKLGYLDVHAPRKLRARLNQLFNRSRLTVEETQILHGIARAIEERCDAVVPPPQVSAEKPERRI